MKKRKAEKICSNFLNYYFKSGRNNSELDYDCELFVNLLQAVWEDVCSFEYPDLDITYSVVEKSILELQSIPSDISSFYDSLVNSIKTTFEKSKGEHFVIIPLHGSELNKVISFENKKFYVIPAPKNEQTIYKRLSKIMSIDYDKCKAMFEHTKRSRSRDFFKHNLLLIRLENQTSHVKLNAITIAIRAIYLIQQLYWALNTTENTSFSLKKLLLDGLEENHHVLIMSNDEWRCGHGYTNKGVPKCKVDLQFLIKKKHQTIFSELFNEFFIEREDELTKRFVNSLVLLNRAFQFEEKKDNDLATLLYTTSAEALLTAGKNEKRLRVAAILPKLISVDRKKQMKIAKILDNVYKKRNEFVHAGLSPLYEYCKNEDSELKIVRIAISKLILKYNEIDRLLAKHIEGNRSTMWDTYVDQLFRSLIFGQN